MTRNDFIAAVMARLPQYNGDNEADRVGRLFDDDFSLNDAVTYARCWEEVFPDLDEDVALARMARIGAKYPKYMARRKAKVPHDH